MARIPSPHRPLEEMPEMMTADEAAPFLRTTGRNLRRWIRDGQVDDLVVEAGPKRLISREQLRLHAAKQVAS